MQEDSPGRSFEQAKEILQEAILRDYPNPARLGCPGSAVLTRLATFDLPQTTDPSWEHITHCSPCYGEFLGFRAEAKKAGKHARQRNRAFLVAAAALVVIGAGWLLSRVASSGSDAPPGLSANASPTAAYVDLESAGILRGDESTKNQQQILKLRIGYLDLKVRLPLGSEDGQYELEILRQPGQPKVASAHGVSVLEDHSVFLRTRVDLRGLSPGRYYMAIRRLNGGWAVYPIELSR
jgi:hypothetical protein